MKWCCSVFQGNYDVAGERGFSILIDRDADGRPRFIIQHRAVKLGDEPKMSSQAPLSLVSETHIKFCPWCGNNLAGFYEKNVDVLTRPNLKI